MVGMVAAWPHVPNTSAFVSKWQMLAFLTVQLLYNWNTRYFFFSAFTSKRQLQRQIMSLTLIWIDVVWLFYKLILFPDSAFRGAQCHFVYALNCASAHTFRFFFNTQELNRGWNDRITSQGRSLGYCRCTLDRLFVSCLSRMIQLFCLAGTFHPLLSACC